METFYIMSFVGSTATPSNKPARRCLSLVCCLVGGLSLTGCGGEKPPPTVPVKGVVTFNETPLESGVVTFQPVKGEAELQRPAIGEIGPGGSYELGTFETGDGALPGKYQVIVVSYANEPTIEEYAQGAKREFAIPEKYTNALTSGLTKEIPAEAPEGGIEFDITLTE